MTRFIEDPIVSLPPFSATFMFPMGNRFSSPNRYVIVIRSQYNYFHGLFDEIDTFTFFTTGKF